MFRDIPEGVVSLTRFWCDFVIDSINPHHYRYLQESNQASGEDVYQSNPRSTVYAMFWDIPEGVVSLTRFWCDFVIDSINPHHYRYLQESNQASGEDVFQSNPRSTVYAMFWDIPEGVVSLTRFWCDFVIDSINPHHYRYLQESNQASGEDVYQSNPRSTVYAMLWTITEGVVFLTRFWCDFVIDSINPDHYRYVQTGTLVNSEDPDEMKLYAPFIKACTV